MRKRPVSAPGSDTGNESADACLLARRVPDLRRMSLQLTPPPPLPINSDVRDELRVQPDVLEALCRVRPPRLEDAVDA